MNAPILHHVLELVSLVSYGVAVGVGILTYGDKSRPRPRLIPLIILLLAFPAALYVGVTSFYRAEAAGSPAVIYANCAAAKADGRAAIKVGEPGYGLHLDRDGDGIACE